MASYSSGSDDDDLIKASRAALEAVSNMLVKKQAAMVAALKATELSDEEGEGRRAKIQRQVYMRPDYDTSAWGTMLKNPALNNRNSKEYRSFRRRFRLPYPVFQHLVELVKERGWFPSPSLDVAGRNCVPVELKVSL